MKATKQAQKLDKINKKEKLLDYIYFNPDRIHKDTFIKKSNFFDFCVSIVNIFNYSGLY